MAARRRRKTWTIMFRRAGKHPESSPLQAYARDRCRKRKQKRLKNTAVLYLGRSVAGVRQCTAPGTKVIRIEVVVYTRIYTWPWRTVLGIRLTFGHSPAVTGGEVTLDVFPRFFFVYSCPVDGKRKASADVCLCVCVGVAIRFVFI